VKSLTSLDKIKIDGFIKVCALNELKEQAGRRFIIDEVDLAVFKLEGEVYALSNVCPHQHTKMIYDGFIERGCVVCPIHGWMFDIQTGNTPTGGRGLDTYETKIIDNDVYAKISRKGIKW
jgi:nitrite reductase/ring-hydroxylating ferredoxin subunit